MFTGATSASAATLNGGGHVSGWVYTSTNATGGNQVQVFSRQADGTLTPAGTYNTGGTGTGTGGFSQGSVTLSPEQQTLLVVNAGSNQVSGFAVLPGGTLRLRNVVASGGTEPTSVAINGGLVEVLNAGGTPNVAGFQVTDSGLTAIADGSQPLSATASGPEDVAISPYGRQVVVTEKLSDTIDTFAVGRGGTLAAAITSPSDSPLSFAEVFTPSGHLLVADDGSAGPLRRRNSARAARTNMPCSRARQLSRSIRLRPSGPSSARHRSHSRDSSSSRRSPALPSAVP